MVTDHIFRNGHCVGIAGDRNLRQLSLRNARSVCVIGAGAAGLCALRHFTARPDRFNKIVCYERSDQIGGTWNYSEAIGIDSYGEPVHSSMYRDLHTNLPIQIMEFPDYACDYRESYIHHSDVARYLHSYSAHFALNQYIRLRHKIHRIERIISNDHDDHQNGCWRVTVHDMIHDQIRIEYYDLVMLCPGRHSVPRWPAMFDSTRHFFSGSLIHSHDYRAREPYTGQRVAVIGGGSSGIDISLEISKVAETVLFVNRTKHFAPLPDNVRQINASLLGFTQNGILIGRKRSCAIDSNQQQSAADVREIAIDSVILATGYRFNLRYLDAESAALRIDGDEHSIDGLYRHMINIRHPSLAILGVNQRSLIPFPLYHQQILYYISILEHRTPLPSVAEMQADVRADLVVRSRSGLRPEIDRHAFTVDLFVDYIRAIERDARLAPLAPVRLRLLRDIEHRIRTQNIMNYKLVNYRLIDDERFEEIA